VDMVGGDMTPREDGSKKQYGSHGDSHSCAQVYRKYAKAAA
jgi:hypothetical protein